MRWIKPGLIIAAALLLLPIAPITLLAATWAVTTGINSVRADAFYGKHRLLAALRAATDGATPGTNPDAARLAVLIDRIPLRTNRVEVVRLLAAESFACKRWNSPRSSYAVDCWLIPQPDYVRRWWVQIDFDDDEALTRAHIFTLKSSESAY